MQRDDGDDTDMTPAAFRAAMERGEPVAIVRSRAAYDRAMDPEAPQPAKYYRNEHLGLAFAGVVQGYPSAPEHS